MPRPHVAALVHDAWNQRVARRLTDRGWGTRIVPHIGYGSTMTLRVLGRVVMDRDGRNGTDDARRSPRAGDAIRDLDSATRWWRDFVSSPAMQVPVAVTIGERTVDTTTDASGLIDLTVRGHGLPPGRHQVLLSTPHADDAHADVIVVSTTQRFGVVSDIDDTVLSTSLPRPVIAAWNTFVREEGTRRAVPGMATLYRELRAAHPDMPFVYLSTGSWNIAPNLGRFLRRHGYPSGPLLLTDWGPTNTGWFRSGQQHKRASLHRLAREFPHIQWLLVGDDGQHDPKVYAEFAAARPGSVRAIAIRQLTTGEQVLSHGLPVANDDLVPAPTEDLPMPVVRAADGYGLARLLRPILGLGRPELTLDPQAVDDEDDHLVDDEDDDLIDDEDDQLLDDEEDADDA
jgi:phosphatidate phosphatase APP1